MSSVVIDYDKLRVISSNSSYAASRISSYINELTSKVSNNYGSIPGGASSKTANSEYYVRQKIEKLKTKNRQYQDFSKAVSKFSSDAGAIDKDVARTIKASKDQFVNKHDYISNDWWAQIKSWFVDLKNSCPLFNAICQMIEDDIMRMKTLFEELKYWYKCDGGKEIIGTIAAVLAAIGAICLLVAAVLTGVGGIVALCGLISAIIGAANALVNVGTSLKAYEAKKNGDPAWAKIYGDQDTMQDVLRQTNFGDGTLNRLSNYGALGIDAVQTVCDVVAIVDGVKNIKNVYKEIKISAQKGKVSFGARFKQYLFNQEHYTSTKNNPVKWRDVLQKRGEIRTLREYGQTTARTIDQYNKSMTKAQKLAKTMKKVGKGFDITSKVIDKTFSSTLGGGGSVKNVPKTVQKIVSGKYNVTKTGYKTYKSGKTNINNLYKDFRSISGIKGLSYQSTLW